MDHGNDAAVQEGGCVCGGVCDPRGGSCVQSDHLLAGILSLGGGVAGNVLVERGVTFEGVVRELGGGLPGVEGSRARRPAMDRSAELALERGGEEARKLNHTYLGMEHLLLGLLSEEAGPCAEIFERGKVDREELRRVILKELLPVG